jgi:hypothetical protein
MGEQAAVTLDQSKKTDDGSIISPFIDFLLVGGISLFVFPIVMLPIFDSEANRLWLTFIAVCLIFVLNMPHFIHSYQLLYRGYFNKLKQDVYSTASKIRLIISGIVAPVFLIAFLIFGVSQKDAQLLGYGTNLMLLTLGWHYVKQGYGTMIALSVRKKAFFDDVEKRILLANAYIVWLFSWFSVNTNTDTDLFHGVPFTGMGFSKDWAGPAIVLFLIWNVIAIFVLFQRSGKDKKYCFNGMASYFFSVYPWVLFAYWHPNIIIFVPALHALQYIMFVWKLEYERTKEQILSAGGNIDKITRKLVFKKMIPFLSVGFGTGIILLSLMPKWLDSNISYNEQIFGPSLFVYCFLIFVNVHHYFIDFAIWRRDNPEMQYLFR